VQLEGGEKTLECADGSAARADGVLPEATKDIKLNLQSVLSESSLSEGSAGWWRSRARSQGRPRAGARHRLGAGPAASEALVDDARPWRR